MATLEHFLRTGQLGPVILGMTPIDVMSALGEPEDTSRKSNPLQLKYGCVQLSFWKTRGQRAPHLSDIAIGYLPKFEPLPEKLAFTDWNPKGPPTEEQFTSFAVSIGYPPVHTAGGPTDRRIEFLSGVTALFVDQLLHSIRLFQRDIKKPSSAPLSDEREPTTHQIYDMLDEADRALRVGTGRASLVLAWAALEASLRRVASDIGEQGKIGIQPSILIRELFSAGRLTPEQHRILEETRQLRTALVHGLAPVEFNDDIVPKIIALAKQLLGTIDSSSEKG